jgi:hypothetical protein
VARRRVAGARARRRGEQVERGEDPTQKKREVRTGLTVSDLIELWLKDGPISRPTKRKWSWTTDASRLRRHAMPLIGRMLIKEVKRRDIEFMQAEIARGATADWVRRKGRGRILATGGPLVAANVRFALTARKVVSRLVLGAGGRCGSARRCTRCSTAPSRPTSTTPSIALAMMGISRSILPIRQLVFAKLGSRVRCPGTSAISSIP